MKKIILTLIIISSVCSLPASETEDSTNRTFKLFKSNTMVKNPLDLRDPFKRRMNKKKLNQAKLRESGTYTNHVENLDNVAIENIRIVGVMIGRERSAMARGNGGKGEIVYIKEGMKLGTNGAEVKAILPGGVVLVEKLRNIYDQDEYLETVLPVSAE